VGIRAWSAAHMTVDACPWLMQWYEWGLELRVPLTEFDAAIVSFIYGDVFPAMRLQDGKPHRGIVFTLDKLPDLIAAMVFRR
jgi:hypothetical protein